MKQESVTQKQKKHNKKKHVFAALAAVLLSVNLLGWPSAAVSSRPAAAEEKKTSDFKVSGKIWIAGDSIAADHSYENEENYQRFVHGWGEVLGNYFTSDVQVYNKAISGQTAKFFTEEENYQDIMDGIGKGDFLLIQFGHNDYKSAGADHYSLPTDTEGSYKWYLKNYYIDPALKAGAMPVLCTSVTLHSYNGESVKEGQAQQLFAEAMEELYLEYCEQGIEIGFIDTYSLTHSYMNIEWNNSASYYANKYDRRTDEEGNRTTSLDHVHFSERGANMAADIISQNLLLLYEDLNRFSIRGKTDGGEGTSENPYLISTWAQIYQILQDDDKNTPDTYYRLTKDIMPTVQKQDWTTHFKANLDCDGHAIKNAMNRAIDCMFDVNEGVISNVKLEYHVNHFRHRYQYPFVRENRGTIRNCTASGRIIFYSYPKEERSLWECGVFAGVNREDGLIEACSNRVEINMNTNVLAVYLGGIAGRNEGTIRQCTNEGILFADSSEWSYKDKMVHQEVVCCAGGIAGIVSDNSNISGCSSKKLPETRTSLKYETGWIGAGEESGVTETQLKQYLEEQKASQEPAVSEPVPTTAAVMPGDVNGDEHISLHDARLALRIALNLMKPEENQIKAADLDGDGIVVLADAQKILRAALNLEGLK